MGGFNFEHQRQPANWKHFNQIERCQIASLMKVHHSLTEIARMVGSQKSKISRKSRPPGYRTTQASKPFVECPCHSRIASMVETRLKKQTSTLLSFQRSHEDVARGIPARREANYHYVYADRIPGGNLWKNLPARCKRICSALVGEAAGGKSTTADCRVTDWRTLKVGCKSFIGNTKSSLARSGRTPWSWR